MKHDDGEFMGGPNSESRYESQALLRSDKYDFCYFSPEEAPEAVLLAKRIQAQSYLNMHFVQPEGLIPLPGGGEILAPDIDKPVNPTNGDDHEYKTEYVVGAEKGSADMDPVTGKLVTWKKFYAPLDALPAYHFSKDELLPEWHEYLRSVETNPAQQLVEIEAMGKTANAGRGVIAELMRNELQRARGKGEIWFFTIVSTTHQAFVGSWGNAAVRRVGRSKRLAHPNVYGNVMLVPGVIDVDNFYMNMKDEIIKKHNPSIVKQMRNFLYMTDGLDDAALGPELATFRNALRHILGNEEEQ